MYQVIDMQTKKIISTHASLRKASDKCDRLDNAYGAVRYIYKFVAV